MVVVVVVTMVVAGVRCPVDWCGLVLTIGKVLLYSGSCRDILTTSAAGPGVARWQCHHGECHCGWMSVAQGKSLMALLAMYVDDDGGISVVHILV